MNKVKLKLCPDCGGDGYFLEIIDYEDDGTPVLGQRMCDACQGLGEVEDGEDKS